MDEHFSWNWLTLIVLCLLSMPIGYYYLLNGKPQVLSDQITTPSATPDVSPFNCDFPNSSGTTRPIIISNIACITFPLSSSSPLPTPLPSPVLGNIYYVSTTGSDLGNGSISSAWATIKHALPLLQPGDQLNLRGGTYFENNLTQALTGTAVKPITIQSFPGEQAIIDGGKPDYLVTNSNKWLPCDGIKCPIGINEYYSATIYSPTNTVAKAWLVDNNMQILRYCTTDGANCKAADMESSNYLLSGANPMYFGPGINIRSDGRLYIRLIANPNDLYDQNNHPIASVPADPDPNHNRLAISVATTIGNSVIFNNISQYVTFSNVTFAHAGTLFTLKSGSQYVLFNGDTFLYGKLGLSYAVGVSNVEVASSIFDGQHPWYLYWTDVKNANSGSSGEVAEGYPDFQSGAIGGIATNSNIHDSLIENGFDGVAFTDGTNLSLKNNQFLNLHDDSTNFWRGTCGEVAHNFFWHVDSGFAILPSTASQCDLYIHHNVFDNTSLRRGGRPNNYRKQDWPVWNTDTPFAKHDTGNKDAWWKVYNNTFISRAVPYGTSMNPFSLNENPAGGDVYNNNYAVVNNIFYASDNRVIYRDHLVVNGGIYDGNDVWHGTAGGNMFQNFGDGGTYTSLAAFQAKNTGWETHGLQVDPGYNLAAISDPSYNYPTILSRYYPTNLALSPIRYSYASNGITWPETIGVNYIGAFPPVGP